MKTVAVGDLIPNFTLNNINGRSVDLDSLLTQDAVSILFDRGQWCPYDSLELWMLQKFFLKQVTNTEKLIIISPRVSPALIETLEKQSFQLEFLLDPEYEVTRSFGLMRKIPAFLRSTYERFGIQCVNSDSLVCELMVHAIYTVECDRRVTYSYIEMEEKKPCHFRNRLAVRDEEYWLALV
ncbi:MAG: redoxin domain-containing protein [Limnospira sp.]